MTHYTPAATSDHAVALAEAAEQRRQDGATGIKRLSDGKSDEFRVNPFSIHVEKGFNARRFSDGEGEAANSLKELAASIVQHGVQKALTVRLSPQGDHLILVDGERRLRATMIAINDLGAAIETVPVKMEPRGTNEADRLASQVMHNSGRPFEPLELASIVKRLSAYGWDATKIHKSTGMDARKQQGLVYLLTAPPDVQAGLGRGDYSADAVTKTLRRSASGEEASRKLSEAATTARAAGRRRVTASDVAGNDATLLRTFQLIMAEVEAADRVDLLGENAPFDVLVRFSAAQWAVITRRFGLRSVSAAASSNPNGWVPPASPGAGASA